MRQVRVRGEVAASSPLRVPRSRRGAWGEEEEVKEE